MQNQDLISWIKKRGVTQVSKLLGVPKSTVENWAYLKGVPQFDNAYKLKILSRGVLGFDEIYQPYFNKIHKQNQNKN